MSNIMINKAAEAIASADCLLIIAGAGMGVDSGLPDFRGNKGFWKVHANFEKEGLSFQDLATPHWFDSNPSRAWGFYGHRHQLYKKTVPHKGFQILKKWFASKSTESFVYTSNVDGHFQKAGFSEQMVYECHGAINYFQCCSDCNNDIWHSPDFQFTVDEKQLLAEGELPSCINCGDIARPNILMFNDSYWLSHRSEQQAKRYKYWKGNIRDKSLTIIEVGAGISGCSARWESRQACNTLIRINPTDAAGKANTVSIQSGALDALLAINELLEN